MIEDSKSSLNIESKEIFFFLIGNEGIIVEINDFLPLLNDLLPLRLPQQPKKTIVCNVMYLQRYDR